MPTSSRFGRAKTPAPTKMKNGGIIVGDDAHIVPKNTYKKTELRVKLGFLWLIIDYHSTTTTPEGAVKLSLFAA